MGIKEKESNSKADERITNKDFWDLVLWVQENSWTQIMLWRRFLGFKRRGGFSQLSQGRVCIVDTYEENVFPFLIMAYFEVDWDDCKHTCGCRVVYIVF